MSQLFTKTTREVPKDEQSVSAQLLIRAGYIDKVAAGVYTLLPLGYMTVWKLANWINFDMQDIGAQPITMPALIPKQNWVQSGRWENFDSLFKVKGGDDREYGLGATNEEIVTPMMKRFIVSYKDLPKAVYQITDKFRNEVRAKSGVLRTREFFMKDLYSFHADKDDLDEYYEKIKKIYTQYFKDFEIGDRTYLTYASGGTFAKYSHEFQTESSSGEDEIYVCKKCHIAANREILDKEFVCPECSGKEYEIKKTIEVGNIFKLGTKFSKPFELTYKDENDQSKLVEMGCYGIGIQRLMGTIAEVNHDEKGLIWPDRAAPREIHLISIGRNERCEEVLKELNKAFYDTLYDDRDDVSAGEKFADADLIGVPNRLVVSAKTGDKIEFKRRDSDKAELVEIKDLIGRIVKSGKH